MFDENSTKVIRDYLGNRSIVLIGLMGAGKTTLGRRLSKHLNLNFKDADHEIEAAAGMDVAEFFATFGEQKFREGEEKVIARLLDEGPQILATGGGAYMCKTTRQNIKQNGISIWLRGDLELLMERIALRQTRPLLQVENPREVMQKLIDERYPIYAQADIIIDTIDAPHNVMIDKLLDKMFEYAT
ncbi:MAG: shikimate kinase [Rhizobiales bacterium]|nr:shikimate kinase [Hyphomicrobiales bacterium]NRB15650.1 shikimate kinase [Hyphomicrobiales bacterium]